MGRVELLSLLQRGGGGLLSLEVRILIIAWQKLPASLLPGPAFHEADWLDGVAHETVDTGGMRPLQLAHL